MTINQLINRIKVLAEYGYVDLEKEILVHTLEDGITLEVCGIAFFDYGGIELQAIKNEDE